MVQIMFWRRPGDKSLSEPMMMSSLTHICVTWPQWDYNCHHMTYQRYLSAENLSPRHALNSCIDWLPRDYHVTLTTSCRSWAFLYWQWLAKPTLLNTNTNISKSKLDENIYPCCNLSYSLFRVTVVIPSTAIDQVLCLCFWISKLATSQYLSFILSCCQLNRSQIFIISNIHDKLVNLFGVLIFITALSVFH